MDVHSSLQNCLTLTYMQLQLARTSVFHFLLSGYLSVQIQNNDNENLLCPINGSYIGIFEKDNIIPVNLVLL